MQRLARIRLILLPSLSKVLRKWQNEFKRLWHAFKLSDNCPNMTHRFTEMTDEEHSTYVLENEVWVPFSANLRASLGQGRDTTDEEHSTYVLENKVWV